MLRKTLFSLSLLALWIQGAQCQAAVTDDAFDRLMDGNKRYVNGTPLHPDQSTARREAIAPKQNPFVIIVSCSDSRVPPEIIFDQGLGDLFVVRVAGNVVGPVELDSIEFAADVMGVPLLMVLGHESCGAVSAVLAGQATADDIAAIAPFIEPAVEQAKEMPGNTLTNAIKLNVLQVMKTLNAAPKLSELIQNNALKIVGGYYNLKEGSVEILF